MDDDERARFIREIEQAKDELIRFRNDMNGLAKQMNGMAIDLVSCFGRRYIFLAVADERTRDML